MFDSFLDLLDHGISIDDYLLLRKELVNGRTSAEKRTTLLIKKGSQKIDLLDIAFFSGFSPWLHPWIEISYPYDSDLIEEQLSQSYLNSHIEETVISSCCNILPPAGKIFVSYDADDETRKALMMSIPPIITRLGYLLFKYGCLWFKDWYFPEGGLEGSQKLQGEKPLSNAHKKRQLDQQKNLILSYLDTFYSQSSSLSLETIAVKRGNDLLNMFF